MDIRKTQALRDILKDKSLLKDKCYIDGKWVGGTATIDVTNPVNESVIGTRAEAWRRRNPAAPSKPPSAPRRNGPRRPPRSAPPSCANGST